MLDTNFSYVDAALLSRVCCQNDNSHTPEATKLPFGPWRAIHMWNATICFQRCSQPDDPGEVEVVHKYVWGGGWGLNMSIHERIFLSRLKAEWPVEMSGHTLLLLWTEVPPPFFFFALSIKPKAKVSRQPNAHHDPAMQTGLRR